MVLWSLDLVTNIVLRPRVASALEMFDEFLSQFLFKKYCIGATGSTSTPLVRSGSASTSHKHQKGQGGGGGGGGGAAATPATSSGGGGAGAVWHVWHKLSELANMETVQIKVTEQKFPTNHIFMQCMRRMLTPCLLLPADTPHYTMAIALALQFEATVETAQCAAVWALLNELAAPCVAAVRPPVTVSAACVPTDTQCVLFFFY
jgi:hypothetical protein